MQSGSSVAPFAAQALSRYAAALRFDALPADVARRAKDCFVDAIGAAVYGHDTAAAQAGVTAVHLVQVTPGNWGVQFAAVGSVVYREALRRGFGQRLPLQWFVQSIRN